jgi:hypothetical protein
VLSGSATLRTEHAAARRVLLALCALALAVAGHVSDARAAAAAPARAVFALEPIGGSAHPGYFVLDAQPGATVQRAVRVANTGRRAGTVRLYAADATTGQTTGAVYRARRDPRRDVGAWIQLPASELHLEPNESRTIPFAIAIPAGAGDGQHLGGVVAENATLTRGSTRRRARGSFRIDVRSLTIIAVQVNLPGPRRELMALTGVRAGGSGGRQALLVGMRNDGNQLIKGRGRLVVRDEDGAVVKRQRFPVDTFVPGTEVSDPIPVPGRALPPGAYRASVTLRYGHGRIARLDTRFTISREQVEQVFGSRPQQAPPGPAGLPLLVLVLGALALLAVGFLGALLVMRRRRPAASAPAREEAPGG